MTLLPPPPFCHAIDPDGGTYVRAEVDPASAQAIHAWCLATGIPEPTLPGKLHATIIYSRARIAEADAIARECEASITASPAEPEKPMLFDSPKHPDRRALVISLAAPELARLHEKLLAAGATSDYPEFTPHLTLTRRASSDFDLSALAFPPMPIAFSRVVSGPLPERRSSLQAAANH